MASKKKNKPQLKTVREYEAGKRMTVSDYEYQKRYNKPFNQRDLSEFMIPDTFTRRKAIGPNETDSAEERRQRIYRLLGQKNPQDDEPVKKAGKTQESYEPGNLSSKYPEAEQKAKTETKEEKRRRIAEAISPKIKFNNAASEIAAKYPDTEAEARAKTREEYRAKIAGKISPQASFTSGAKELAAQYPEEDRTRENIRQNIRKDLEEGGKRAEEQKKIAQFAAGELNYGGWTSGRTDEAQEALRLSTAQEKIQGYEDQKESGYYNTGNDYGRMNAAGLDKWEKHWNEQMETAGQRAADLKSKTDQDIEQEGANLWTALVENDAVRNEQAIINGAGYTEQEKETARKTLQELTTDARITYYKIRDLWKTGQRKPAELSTVYDWVNGKGAYQKRTAGISEEEKNELDAKITKAYLAAITDPQEHSTLIKNAESDYRYAQGQLEQIANTREWNSKYEQAMASAPAEGDTAFHAENDNKKFVNMYAETMGNGINYANDPDFVYSFINGGSAYEEISTLLGDEVIPHTYKNIAMMLDDEIEVFNKYYNAGKKDEAMAFIDGLSGTLNQRASIFEDIRLKELSTRSPILATAATYGATVAQDVEFLRNAAVKGYDLITGRNSGLEDANGQWRTASRFKRKVRQDVGENMSETARFFYNAANSAIDSAINYMIAKNLPGAGLRVTEAETLGQFAMQAFESSMEQNLQETNGDYGRSAASAIIDALIETGTEIFSVEKILSEPTKKLMYILKAAGSEASEEFVGSVLGPYIHELFEHKNEWKQLADEIWNNKQYTDSNGNVIQVKTYNDAYKIAMQQWNHEILTSTLSGAISTGGGVFHMAGYALSEHVNTNRMGDSLLRRNESQQSGLDDLIRQGQEAEEGSKARTMADDLRTRIDKGETIKKNEAGKFAMEMLRENEAGRQKAEQSATEEKALEMIGPDAKNAKETAAAVAKALDEGEDSLTRQEKKLIRQNEQAQKIIEESRQEGENETKTAIREAQEEAGAEYEERGRQLRRTITRQGINISVQSNQTLAERAGEQVASEEEIRQAEGQRSGSKNDVLVEGKHAKVLRAENGKYIVEVDGKQETRTADEIRTLDLNTAAIIRQRESNPSVYSEAYTNKLLELNDQQDATTDTGRLMMDAESIRMAAFMRTQMPQTSLSEKAAWELREISEREATEEWKKSQEQLRGSFLGKNKGEAYFGGFKYGEKGFQDQLEGLSQEEKDAVNMAAMIAKRFGFRLDIKRASEMDNALVRGADTGKGIVLNVEGFHTYSEKTGTGTKQSLLVTLGHELTHFLRRNNVQGYFRVQEYVVQKLGAGTVAKRAQDLMDQYESKGKKISLTEAIEEVVANSCDQLLASQEAADYLKKNQPGLFKQIQEYVKGVIGRIKAVLGNMRESMSNESMQMAKYANELAKIWLGAYDEILEGRIQEAEQTLQEQEIEKLSLSEIAEEYDGAIESGDMEAARALMLGYAEKKGYSEEAYHGTEKFGFTKFDLQEGKGVIFVAYSENISGTYTTNGRVRTIQSANEGRFADMSGADLAKAFQEEYGSQAGYEGKPVNGARFVSQEESRKSYRETRGKQLAALEGKEWFSDREKEMCVRDAVTALKSLGVTYDALAEHAETPASLQEHIYSLLENSSEVESGPAMALKNLLYKYGTTENGERISMSQAREMAEEAYWSLENASHESGMIEFDAGAYGKTMVPAEQAAAEMDHRHGNDGQGIYQLVVRPGKQLVIDAEGREWNQIIIPGVEGEMTTREAAEWAREHGYDSVRINNVWDSGGRGTDRASGTGDIGIFFNPNDVKSGDTVTYDDAGKPINLQERFNDQETDIRYSIADMEKLSWEEQVEKASDKKLNPDDVLVVAKPGEMEAYGIDGHLVMTQSIFRKNVRTKKENSRSAHGLSVPTMKQLQEHAKKPVAKITTNEGIVLITDLKDENEDYIVLPAIQREMERGKKVWDIRSAHGRPNMALLFGESKDGVFTARPGVSVTMYNKNAADILRTCAIQFGTPQQINSVLESLTHKDEKSNPSDGRWSMAEEGMDVNAWMMSQTPSSVMTESERELISAYRGLRTKIDLTRKRIMDYTKRMQALEAKTDTTLEERDEMRELRNKIQVNQDKLTRLEEELYDVTSGEGYARVMQQQSHILKDFVNGKTQAQVQASIDTMSNEAERAEREIEQRKKMLQRMAEGAAVKTVKRELGRLGLRSAVDALRTQYATNMSRDEMESRFAEIVIKMANGEDVTEDVQALANDIATNVKGWGSEEADEILGRMRGMTIVIGPGQQAEMKANHITLKDLRARTKGSGIRFVFGERSTLDANAEELMQTVPELRGKLENEKASLFNVVDFVEGLLAQKKGNAADYGINPDEVTLTVKTIAEMMLNEQAGGMNGQALLEKIKKEAGIVGKALEAVEEARQSVERIKWESVKARGPVSVLARDAAASIKYFNEMSKQAAEVERQRVRKGLIEVLSNEHTRDLIRQQEEYEERIKKDKKARELHADNEQLRHQITTVTSRIRKRLTEETDQKNIPEEAKPLARMISSMLVNHDMSGSRRVLNAPMKALQAFAEKLMRMDVAGEKFDPERDLSWLVIKAPNEQDNDYTLRDKVWQDLIDIEQGLLEYRTAEGRGNVTLADRKAALKKVQTALSEIWSVIQARSQAEIAGRKYQVFELAEQMDEDMEQSRFKGERKGFGSKARNTFWKAVGYGNLTPEYFFKNLKNRAMSLLHRGMQDAEQRSGLEAQKARDRIARIAAETGYATWDGQEKHTIKLASGRTITITTEQLMALYATWKRESNALRPQETSHLLHGGFILPEADTEKGKPRREKTSQVPIRMTEAELESLGDMLTEQQREFVDQIVEYMSTDLAELGNEASMRTYGIKKFTEQYYFPIRSWGGVLNSSSDRGMTSSRSDNRAMRQSFTKRVTNNASNAIEIADFTPTAMKHIVGMITFNTVGPAVENMNKVLNQQLQYGEIKTDEATGEENDYTYKRNMRARFQEAYGVAALEYLEQFMKDVNGGVSRRKETSMREKLLSIFKKNAVAGSLSVAAQQPLSYIRAAMMISPKYLAAAINPKYWKGSYREMMEHSGIAVIKEMGKFDMNYGRSMEDFITPEGMTSRGKRAMQKASDIATGLPQKMDAMTWTRMWTACKLETQAKNPGLQGEELLKKTAERFNDVMRRTQVYDSVMVKSANMRSDSYLKKVATSFMAEPTLSLNVLADAWQNIREAGGMKNAAKALVTFVLSAAAQAGAKAFFGAGRTPDKKKTKEENFLNKFGYNLLNEMNVLGLIPGYNSLMSVLIDGELKDDAMGVIGKAVEVYDKIAQLATGEIGKKGLYRDLEDSVGQLFQLATPIPLKNAMRDFRAMVNFFSNGTATWTGDTYANRPTSNAVLKYQAYETLMSQDIIGLINKRLGDAGYKTDNVSYYERIYDAIKRGDKQAAEELKEYMLQTKITAEEPEKSLEAGVRKVIKADESLSTEESLELQKEYGLKQTGSYVLDQYKEGKIDRKQAEKLYRKENPNKTDKDVMEAFDKIDYEKAGGDAEHYSNYTPLYDAIEKNKADEIKQAVKKMMDAGYTQKQIKAQMTSKYKEAYLNADSNGKIKIRNAIQLVYKAIGLTAQDADKIIDGWKKKDGSSAIPAADGYRAAVNTKNMTVSDSGGRGRFGIEGRYGKGNIDLNNRKVVHNEDGTISTERSFSTNIDGKEILLPTVIDGKIVSEREAIQHYFDTGEYLGIFDTPEEADEYAENLHKRQEWYYGK